MGGGGLLIFYVTNETNETNVRPSKSPKTHPKIRDFGGPEKGDFSFWCILYRILVHFVPDFLAQKPYLCTEFQSALKLQTSN